MHGASSRRFNLAKVVKVYDGDTFYVEAYAWPGINPETNIRILGIDTPEKRTKWNCKVQYIGGDISLNASWKTLDFNMR